MSINKYDVIIVGGGLIGLATSIFLSKIGLKIIIVEKNGITINKSTNYDLRTTAISEGTKKILENFGVWSKLKNYAQEIKTIKVYDRNSTNNIKFTNPKQTSFLGYIVENFYLKKILLDKIKRLKNIRILQNITINNIINHTSCIEVITNKRSIKANLLIAADGKNSFVRKFKKQSVFSKQYKQSALVINLQHTKNHNNTAYEIFYKSGPLAILPMKKSLDNKFRSSLVWTHNKEFVENMYNLSEDFLSLVIDERIQEYIGNTIKIINKKFFPLGAHINSSFGSDRIIYVGDSAHSIHPIAGQGWNLGMRDAETLSKIVSYAQGLGLEIGSNYVCKKFNNERFFDVFGLYQVTDKLNTIFMKEKILYNSMRGIGFKIIEKNKKLNNFISSYAMGLRS